ncbi:hypothetical protein [Nocardioides acrostichi]|uniref:Uncharacterized protein n=1 Tax=Nocardioides acrostichi TaxID=2784339 RepID=A0A930UTS9_9ACTN|nr:hypothetical protein [Nocardioides acrostichi]MBF4160693.1 hypothetical protein [Nocardioides acrostichi]
MTPNTETHARAHLDARLTDAAQRRRDHELVRAQRFHRKAERTAQRARLALARAL